MGFEMLHGVLTHKKIRFGVNKKDLGFFSPGKHEMAIKLISPHWR
jgi:hypothetical protein